MIYGSKDYRLIVGKYYQVMSLVNDGFCIKKIGKPYGTNILNRDFFLL